MAALLVWAVAVVILQRWLVVLGVLAGVVVAVFLLVGLGWRLLWRQVRPMLPFVVLIAVMHVIGHSWHNAVAVPMTILVLVVAAALVTLTTPASAMIDVVTRASAPLRHVGVNPERVGLAVLLGLRCVPLMSALASRVRQAQIARSGAFDLRAFAVPLVVAAVRQAESLGEALVARGVDD